MEWKKIERERHVGFEPTEAQIEIVHHLEIPEGDWPLLEGAVVEFWVRLCVAISEAYAGRSDEIEAIDLSFRPDCGMLYAHPRLQDRRPALKERTSAMAHSLLVERLWFDLPDPDKDPAGFESAHDQLMTQWIETVRAAAGTPAAAQAIASLRQQHPIKILGFHYTCDDKNKQFELIP